MPPLRSARASQACDLCRKHKTRCYALQSNHGTCLRCETLSQSCSLQRAALPRTSSVQDRRESCASAGTEGQGSSISERLARLEETVQTVVKHLDAQPNGMTISSHTSPAAIDTGLQSPVPSDYNPAPLLLIRHATDDAGLTASQLPVVANDSEPDVIATGLVTMTTATSLMELFRVHYGRWVRFPENIPISILLSQTRKSPLLLCSVFLIAVRHKTEELADHLGPKLFQEVKRLVQQSILIVSQPVEFFQAVIILCLWSTTIGQVPLSIDSWLLTSNAIVQATSSPVFSNVIHAEQTGPIRDCDLDVWYIWNHLCVAHLQYCVSLRRQSFLSKAQVDMCLRVAQVHHDGNYEARMTAEVGLYWIIYQDYCSKRTDLLDTKRALQNWKQDWAKLFCEQRSQFLEMGFNFAHLLASTKSLRTHNIGSKSSILTEMICLSKRIINLAIETEDERTRHLTDHIYHILVFSAMVLTRIINAYEPKLEESGHNIASLEQLVVGLATWLRSIGLRCHISRLLGQALMADFKKLRPRCVIDSEFAERGNGEPGDDQFRSDIGFSFPDFIESELLSLNTDAVWPQWDSN